MFVRKFEPKDAEKVSELVVTTLRTTNIKDYSLEYIENDVKILQPQNILERANWMHFYVVCDAEKIVGCGAIGPYWDKDCLLYTSPSPRDYAASRMPSSA